MRKFSQIVTILIALLVIIVSFACRDNTVLRSTLSLYCVGLIFVINIVVLIVEKVESKDGTINITETPEKTIWNFELSKDPDDIRKRKTVTFAVRETDTFTHKDLSS